MDIQSFDLEAEAEKGGKFELMAPRAEGKIDMGDGLGVFFEVLGDESSTFARNIRAMQDHIRANLASEPKDPDAIARLVLARTVACAVTGWKGLEHGGIELPFSQEAAVELFSKRPWIARQIDMFRRNPGNFAPH